MPARRTDALYPRRCIVLCRCQPVVQTTVSLTVRFHIAVTLHRPRLTRRQCPVQVVGKPALTADLHRTVTLLARDPLLIVDQYLSALKLRIMTARLVIVIITLVRLLHHIHIYRIRLTAFVHHLYLKTDLLFPLKLRTVVKVRIPEIMLLDLVLLQHILHIDRRDHIVPKPAPSKSSRLRRFDADTLRTVVNIHRITSRTQMQGSVDHTKTYRMTLYKVRLIRIDITLIPIILKNILFGIHIPQIV